MRKTFKFRIYPNKKQTAKLERIISICRSLYNDAITERRDAWKTCRKSINYYNQANQLKEIKTFDDELRGIHSQVIQDVLRRVEKAYKNFYRRVKKKERKAGFPRYKGRNRYDSFTYPQYGNGAEIKNGKLYLSKIGDVRIIQHRPIEGNIKTCTIKRDVDQWYACFGVEIEQEIEPVEINTAVGVDVGLNYLITTSDGEQIKPPKHLRLAEKKLAKEQRRLSRKKKRSKNRNKQRTKVARTHRKIKNQRKDFNHKLSRKLVDSHDLIAFENLNILGMLKNHHLAKSISDAGWYQLQTFVSYKAEWAGKYVEFVDARGTSIDCSVCGEAVSKTLATRIHRCPNCGVSMDRDVNAARNILERTHGQWGGACGGVA